jgi:hypothetical protein
MRIKIDSGDELSGELRRELYDKLDSKLDRELRWEFGRKLRSYYEN